MVEAVKVFRVKNPDGTTTDFASEVNAIRHEVRIELLTAIAGMPENATADQESMITALIDDATKFSRLLAAISGHQAVAADIRPAAPPVVRPPPPVRAAHPAAGRSHGPGGNRGPGYTVRHVGVNELGKGAAFGDGKDEV